MVSLLKRHWTDTGTILDVSEKIVEVGVAALMYIYIRDLVAYTFVLECSASFRQIKYETKHLPRPLLARFQLMQHAVAN